MFRMLIFTILLTCKLSGQVLVDTNTIKLANTYLVKGAIARQKVAEYKKILELDSIIIVEQDTIISKQKINIGYIKETNNALVKQNKAISRTLILWQGVSIILTILTFLSWLQ